MPKRMVLLPAALVVVGFLVTSSLAKAEPRRAMQKLGERLFSDINLSSNRNQSCETCHSLTRVEVPTEIAPGRFRMANQPALGRVDPSNVRDGTAVSNGSVARAFGSLNAPSAAYAAFSPEFHWDEEEELFFGGQF